MFNLEEHLLFGTPLKIQKMAKLFEKLRKQKQVKEPKITYFTSECVSPGHPDKMCDTIADSIKDYILDRDHNARIAVEVAVTSNFVLLMGEVTTSIKVPYAKIVRDVIKKIGYIHEDVNFCYSTVHIENLIHSQSADINLGTNDVVGGAGDQGMQFGYACNESWDYIPFTWKLARALTSYAFKLQKDSHGSLLRPDIKAQVTCKYVDGVFDSIDTIVLACSHVKVEDINEFRDYCVANIITPVLNNLGYSLYDVERVIVNGTGKFEIYGPHGDSGLTGRKLVVDLYGGHAATGGGTLQGKDPTKTDNSAALMARYLAKNIVAAGLAEKCQIQLAYCIGVDQPVSINVETFGTEHCDVSKVEKYLKENVSCSPRAIIERFDLRKQNSNTKWRYRDCGAFGYIGGDMETFYKWNPFPWEETNLVHELLQFKKD